MSKEVYANGRAVSCKAGAGKVICGFPDVCLSPPSPPAGPIPVPYPDSSFSKDLKKGSKTVKIGRKPAALRNTSFFKSSPLGNEAATRSLGAGIVSHVITGKTYFCAWSFNVSFEGKSVVRHLDVTTSNHASHPGNEGVPMVEQEKAAPEKAPERPTCPPHDWRERSRETPEQTKEKNAKEAAHLKTKPSKALQATGPEFENKAIDENMDRLGIQATSVIYQCSRCNAEQEVDILGRDTMAEAKSRKTKGWKNAKPQHENYVELQSQILGGGRPLGKADGEKLSEEDRAWLEEKLDSRGLDTEIL